MQRGNNNNNHICEASEVTSPRQLLTEFPTIFAFEFHRRFYTDLRVLCYNSEIIIEFTTTVACAYNHASY